MKRIVLVSREPANRRRLTAMVQNLFPECPVEIVARKGSDSECSNNPVDKEEDVTEGKILLYGS